MFYALYVAKLDAGNSLFKSSPEEMGFETSLKYWDRWNLSHWQSSVIPWFCWEKVCYFHLSLICKYLVHHTMLQTM